MSKPSSSYKNNILCFIEKYERSSIVCALIISYRSDNIENETSNSATFSQQNS